MIIELTLVIIIVIIILTEFIKYVMPSATQRMRGECPCESCVKSNNQSRSIFRERFSNPLIFQDPYDENKLFKYDMDNSTRLRYWH
jgi:hypothetical protein